MQLDSFIQLDQQYCNKASTNGLTRLHSTDYKLFWRWHFTRLMTRLTVCQKRVV